MRYAIVVYETAAEFAARDDAALRDQYWAGYIAYGQALRDAGIAAGGAGLQAPHAATTVRVRGGSRQVVDGPYSEIKEQLGGFYIINVPDLDVALAWAEKCPAAATGVIEVRPLIAM